MECTMRDLRLSAAIIGIVAIAGLANAPVAKAANADYVNGGSCQLSIPTTDTKFRPKASGARNESTDVGNFVICNIQHTESTGLYSEIRLAHYSLDGIARDLTCTAVVGVLGGSTGNNILYSSKTMNTLDPLGAISWYAPDFGGASGAAIPQSRYVSITCNLPPQTGIKAILGVTN
jgi:hypothetical protein